jgi:hypothetical protein
VHSYRPNDHRRQVCVLYAVNDPSTNEQSMLSMWSEIQRGCSNPQIDQHRLVILEQARLSRYLVERSGLQQQDVGVRIGVGAFRATFKV